MWIIVRITKTINEHCGYEFPWSPYRLFPMTTTKGYHDFHHSYNLGNYCSFFRIWDSIFGYNKVYYKGLE